MVKKVNLSRVAGQRNFFMGRIAYCKSNLIDALTNPSIILSNDEREKLNEATVLLANIFINRKDTQKEITTRLREYNKQLEETENE